MKLKNSVLLAICIIVLSACTASEPPIDQLPTPYPGTPAPVAINAPVVESPALVHIHFINELDGWGVTETQIVRTNDGGLTWYNVTPPEVTKTGYGVTPFALDVNHFWMQVPDFNSYPNSGFLQRTTDGGLTWKISATPFSGGDIQFVDAENGWMLADLGVGAGSNAVAIYQTTDSGGTWEQKYVNDPNVATAGDSLPLGGLKSGIAPLNTQAAWVYGVIYAPATLYLYRTEDGGKNWSAGTSIPLPPGVENSELGIDRDHMKFVSPTEGFIAVRITGDTTETAVYVSKDAGQSWSLTPTLIPNGGSADFLSATEAVIYNGEQFYVTRDAARTWNTVAPDVVFGDTFAMLDFVNTTTGWVITVDPATNQHILYRTTDGGTTWLPVIP